MTETEFDTTLPINQKYSTRAVYINEGDTIIAIDGNESIDIEKESDCDDPCFKVDEAELNL